MIFRHAFPIKLRILIILFLVLSMASIIADNPLSVGLVEGKNNFTIEEYFPSIYASELIEKYPQIQSISISEYSNTFGYVNVLGGIGTNIIVESSKDYEIYVNKSLIIYLKN